MPSLDPEFWGKRVRQVLQRHAGQLVSQSAEDSGVATEATPPALARYQLRERLGEGATAEVFSAWDQELARPVAIKILKQNVGLDDVARARFRREAHASAALVHPNVVTVFDTGEVEGRPYLVMELVSGQPLSTLLQTQAIAPREMLELLEKVALGVAAAHREGIVHRDLKPANLLVTGSGVPKVADFGLARAQSLEPQLTETGTAVGTPLYMAPEQVDDRLGEVTPRTDVYALGVILYEALVGRRPHAGGSVLELFGNILREDPRPARSANPRISRDLETIILKAMDKSPGRRYATAGELAEDLRRHRLGEPIEARRLSAAGRLWRQSRRHSRILVPALAAALVSLGALLWGLEARRQAEAERRLFHLPRVSSAEGSVSVFGRGSGTKATVLSLLRHGETLETWSRATAGLTYSDSIVIGMEPLTRLRETSTPSDRAIFLERGSLRVDAKGAPLPMERPLSILTSLARVEVGRGVFFVRAAPDETRIESRLGSVRVTRRFDGNSASVSEEEALSIRPDAPLTTEPIDQQLKKAFRNNRGIDDSLVGFWTFDEGRDSVARDASRIGLTARLLDGTQWAVEPDGAAVLLDGKGTGVEFPRHPILDRLEEGSYSLSAWFRPEATSRAARDDFENGHAIVMKGPFREGLMYSARGRFFMFHWTEPRTWASAGTWGATFPPGRWYHVAGVVDRAVGRTSIFVDGRPHGSEDWSGPPAPSSARAWLAGKVYWNQRDTYFAEGSLRNVRAYRRSLSPAEVALLHEIEK